MKGSARMNRRYSPEDAKFRKVESFSVCPHCGNRSVVWHRNSNGSRYMCEGAFREVDGERYRADLVYHPAKPHTCWVSPDPLGAWQDGDDPEAAYWNAVYSHIDG
jgi:hypothetical protein